MSDYGHLSPDRYVARVEKRLSLATMRRPGRVPGLYRCQHGHNECALEPDGRCYQDERQILEARVCSECHGEGTPDPWADHPEPCRTCHGTGKP